MPNYLTLHPVADAALLNLGLAGLNVSIEMTATKKSVYEKLKDSADVEYAGVPGSSADCRNAVIRLIQHGDQISEARILTHEREHAFLLSVNGGDQVVIKSGFTSGYGGAGPNAFSYVLKLLEEHGAEIEEYVVSEEVIARADLSCLRARDLTELENKRPQRPRRWHDYILERHWSRAEENRLWEEFPTVMPFAIIDERLIDIALTFWDAPSDRLLTAFRRLEDFLRKRTGLADRGGKLFANAFLGDTPKLIWKGCDKSECASRGELFRNVFTAFRNARAHGECDNSAADQLSEFLLINQLFRLEKAAANFSNQMER